jgi:hypothetical protein
MRPRRIFASLSRRIQRFLPDILAYGFFIALAVWTCGRLWADPYNQISGHLPTDHIWFQWLLTHGAHSVAHLENPLFSTQMNAPNGVNMMANTSVLAVSLPLAPITLWLGPQISYVLYLTLALAGSAAAAYYVLSRHLVNSRLAAFIGGGFFGFAPGIVHHASGQPNFVSNFLLPFIVLRVFKLRERDRIVRNGIILGLLVACQVFINEELLLLTAVSSVVAVAVYYGILRRPEAKLAFQPFLKSGLIAVAVALPLVTYPVWFQFCGPQSYRGIPSAFADSGEDIMAYFTFARDTLAGSAAVEKTIGVTEQNSWFGLPLMALLPCLVLLTWRRSVVTRMATVVGAIFAVLALGPTVRFNGDYTPYSGPWKLFNGIPMLEFMVASRMTYVVIACVAVLLAIACDLIPKLRIKKQTPVSVAVVWYLLIAVALVPIIPKPIPATHTLNVPAFITYGSWRPYVDNEHSMVTVPMPSNVQGLKSLLWQAVSEQEYKTPRGYFLGPNVNGTGMFGAPHRPTSLLSYRVETAGNPVITAKERSNAVEDLRYWRAAIIVLDETDDRADALRQFVTKLIGIEPIRTEGVWLWDVRPIVDGVNR